MVVFAWVFGGATPPHGVFIHFFLRVLNHMGLGEKSGSRSWIRGYKAIEESDKKVFGMLLTLGRGGRHVLARDE